jgi:hypothetical protein
VRNKTRKKNREFKNGTLKHQNGTVERQKGSLNHQKNTQNMMKQHVVYCQVRQNGVKLYDAMDKTCCVGCFCSHADFVLDNCSAFVDGI